MTSSDKAINDCISAQYASACYARLAEAYRDLYGASEDACAMQAEAAYSHWVMWTRLARIVGVAP
jgi:hypothetical protein